MDTSQWIRILFVLGMCVSYVCPSPYYKYKYRPVIHTHRRYVPAVSPAKVIHVHHVHSGSSGSMHGHGYRPQPTYTMHGGGHYYHHHYDSKTPYMKSGGSWGGHGSHGKGSSSSLMDLLVMSSVLGNNNGVGGLFGTGANNNNLLPVMVAGQLG